MKKILFSVLTIACTLIYGAASASEGGRSGSTSSPGEGNCTSCHSDFSLNSGGGSVSVTSNIPSWSYTPGQTYTINVTIAQTGMTVYGWDMEALKSTGASGGKMLITNSTKSQILYKTVSGNSRANFTHKLNGGLANNTFTISFDWLAPTVDSGNVTLYFNGLAGDHDGSEAGDYIYTGTQVITPASISVPLVLNCATDLNVSACQTQAAINTAYNNWLATATISGGCGALLTNNSTGAPLACGGSKTVTWTATSTCGTSQSCSATFTVTSASSVALTTAANQNAAGCQTQTAVNAAYATWLNSVSVSGGCNTVLTNNSTGAPLACGGSKTVIWTATSDCESAKTTTATFTVASASPVALTCAVDHFEAACQTQTAVDAAFATWLASATFNGGCNAVINNDATTAPAACGGSTLVTWTVTSDCESPKTCSATFTVNPSPSVVLSCTPDQNEVPGQSQSVIDAAYATWLNAVTVSGGCNTVLTNNSTGAPLATGGSKTVIWTATSDCQIPQNCTATFTVAGAPPVVLTCANNQIEAGCQGQAAIDAAFNTWLASATVTGGCSTNLTNDATVAPSACGGSVTITWTATSTCNSDVTCSATFTVNTAPTVVVTCPGDQTEAAGQTQTAIDAAYAIWLANVSVTGGCNTSLSNNSTGTPLATGGSNTITWTATSDCESPQNCTATFTVTATGPAPAITSAPAKLKGFSTAAGSYSAPQMFTFSADYLTDDVKLVAPDYYQISLTATQGSWSKTIIVPKDINGQIALTTVYVRFHPAVVGKLTDYVRLKTNAYSIAWVKVVGNATTPRLGIETTEEIVVTLTPNPAVNTLNVSINNTDQNTTVTLFDLTGNKIESMVVASGSLTMDVSNLPQGLYFCRVESGNSIVVKKFVKQ